MKTIRKLILMVVFCQVFLSILAFAQSDCLKCPANPTPVPGSAVAVYKTNYGNNFRTNLTRRQTHSISVDFSKEAIDNFYTLNFMNVKGKYPGFDIHFTTYNFMSLPGHLNKKQIGLLIAPYDTNCKPDSMGYMIFNNSFNQSKGGFTHTPYPNVCTSKQYIDYKGYFYSSHRSSDLKKYTNFIRFDSTLISNLYQLVNSSSSYVGLRFDFGSYNADNMACGQTDKKQITVFISPVLSDGSADYQAYYNFISKKYVGLDQSKYFSSYNHGQLCPTICD